MPADSNIALEKRLIRLFDHLGIQQAHIAGRAPGDWAGLAKSHPEAIASLSLICPTGLTTDLVRNLASQLLIVSGDQGPASDNVRSIVKNLPEIQAVFLSQYDPLGWSDIVADRTGEMGLGLLAFLDASSQESMHPPAERQGKIAGITYQIRGAGPPLVLLPLFLAPSQWGPLIPQLSEQYTTITLGGPELGPVVVLENRGRSRGYRELLSAMMAATSLKLGDSALEVGCGSGAVMRWLAKYTDGQNELTGIDINAYLLAEGKALAKKEGSDALITTKKGSALSIPFPDNSFDITYSVTVIEEVEADPMIAEMIRVTKPGGQVAVICRAADLPWVRNVPIEPDLKAKIEANYSTNVSEGACADASLYRRFRDAGLKDLVTFPHFTPFTSSDPEIVSFIQAGILAGLTPEETQAWHTARARAEEDGSFVLAWPHHCAVGTKR